MKSLFDKASADVKAWLLILTWNLAFWSSLAEVGYPRPHQDDMFFVGAGIHLAHTGVYTNPWIPSWYSMFKSGLFFVQPPFYAFTLAGWIELFGLSSFSLTSFQCVIGAVFSIAATFFVRACY